MIITCLFRSASVVTTSTVVEHDGKQLTSGEHSQKYPLDVSKGRGRSLYHEGKG